MRAGPDHWRAEPARTEGVGLCPRGSCLPELLTHRDRIVQPARRGDGRLEPCDAEAARRAILEAGQAHGILFLLDGNLPCAEILAAADWCETWEQARLCLVVEPADRQLLLGTEASGVEYLGACDLADCDGFLIIGDAFAANPTCSRAVLDRHKADPRTPIVVIDPAAGTATKFATHPIDCRPGQELACVRALAKGAGVAAAGAEADEAGGPASWLAAGKALSQCERPGMLISAEYGRAVPWQRLGQAVGQLANAMGGGVAVQTQGANALAAVRLESRLKTVPLAEALAPTDSIRVAIGCDVLGMLGWSQMEIFAAAAGLPSRTTAAAQVVLPVAMPGEEGGTFLLDGAQSVEVAPLLRPPAGVPTASQIIADLARDADVPTLPIHPTVEEELLERRAKAGAGADPSPAEGEGTALLLGRSAIHAGCGDLTSHASWQAAIQPLPELRIAPADARDLGVANLATVTVQAGAGSVRARVRVAPELAGGAAVLADGFVQCRDLIPCRIDSEASAMVADAVRISSIHAGEGHHVATG